MKKNSRVTSLLRALTASSLAIGALALNTSALAAADPLNFDIATLQSQGNYIVYGDAQSYALQVACTQTGQSGTGCSYYVQGSAGQIQNLVVNGVGANGGPATTNAYPGAMDNAYDLPNTPKNPNNSQLSDWFFRTGGQTVGNTVFSSPDPGGAGEWTGVGAYSGDTGQSWDTKLSALMDYTNNKDPVFFFLNNQSNANGTDILAADQTLAAWARLWITNDVTGTVMGVWEFTNHDSAYNVVPQGGGGIPTIPGYPFNNVNQYSVTSAVLGSDPGVVSNSNTDYVLSGGKVCFQQVGPAPAPGDPIVPCSGAFSYSVDNNLGSNQAAYALLFPEMNTLINSLSNLGNYSLHADIRIGCDPAWFTGLSGDAITQACLGKRLTNGAEAIFIGAAFEAPPICVTNPNLPECQPPQVPEPGVLALAGLGLASLALIRRRDIVGKMRRSGLFARRL